MSDSSDDSIGCAIIVVAVVFLIVMFAGEPDLHDAIVQRLMR